MSEFLERIAKLSAEAAGAAGRRDCRRKLEALERSQREPIAIVGMGCRFPGGSQPGGVLAAAARRRDAVTRGPARPLGRRRLYDPDPGRAGQDVRRAAAGSSTGVDRFDAQFFGISPREAASMDPQQRLLLEVAWEALEHAGQPPDALAGTPHGRVRRASRNSDYCAAAARAGRPRGLDAYLATGNALSVAAGRLSYVLGLQGPSLAVDTACSSSLVAVHLACQSLRTGECRIGAGRRRQPDPLARS